MRELSKIAGGCTCASVGTIIWWLKIIKWDEVDLKHIESSSLQNPKNLSRSIYSLTRNCRQCQERVHVGDIIYFIVIKI